MVGKNNTAITKKTACLRAFRTAKPNRKLVEKGFREHLALLEPTWEREIRFYPNIRAAVMSDSFHLGTYTAATRKIFHRFALSDQLDSAHWIAWRDIGRRPRGNIWVTSWRLAAYAASTSKKTPFDPFIKILQGGCFTFWVGRIAVHVVLAKIHLTQQGLVHRKDGPAIQYEDGSGVWCWNGTLLSEEFVRHPETITAEKVLAEQNAETRRVMIELYGGAERFVSNVDAKVLDERDGNQLISIPFEIDGESPFVALKLRCTSTDRSYILRVSPIHRFPSYRSVKRALADTFGYRNARDYALQAET